MDLVVRVWCTRRRGGTMHRTCTRVIVSALVMAWTIAASADVIPEDYEPPECPNPLSCPDGARGQGPMRGHAPCPSHCVAEQECESNTDCASRGQGATCREVSLCLHRGEVPGAGDYEIAEGTCGSGGACSTGTCNTAKRCVRAAPPPTNDDDGCSAASAPLGMSWLALCWLALRRRSSR